MRIAVPLAVLTSEVGEDERKQKLTHAGCVRKKKGSRPDKWAVIDGPEQGNWEGIDRMISPQQTRSPMLSFVGYRGSFLEWYLLMRVRQS